jgi:hypothetical protein
MVYYNLKLVGQEAKYNTVCQRTWNFHRDPAIRAIEDHGIDNTKGIPLPKITNELSLNIDSGNKLINRRKKLQYI